MKAGLRAIYQRQSFFPGLLGIFINPFFIARRALCDAIKETAHAMNGRMLDIGCGTKPYQSLFTVDSYIGLDIATEISRKVGLADYLYDGRSFPFSDASFDSALCNQVLEHVFNPDEFLLEINRILKPGGKLLLTVPFVWDEHEQPNDYARYSTFGLHWLLKKSGFRIIEHRKLGADATILFQMVNAYLFKAIQNRPRLIKAGLTVTLLALINLAGLIAGKLLPRNPDLFLDHLVLAEKAP